MGNPNLITESGREDMTVTDRIALLESDVVRLQGGDLDPNFRPVPGVDRSVAFREWSKADWHPVNGSSAHAFNSMIGWAQGQVALYRRYPSMTRSRSLSQIECCILAWRRGGHQELKRVRKAQRAIEP